MILVLRFGMRRRVDETYRLLRSSLNQELAQLARASLSPPEKRRLAAAAAREVGEIENQYPRKDIEAALRLGYSPIESAASLKVQREVLIARGFAEMEQARIDQIAGELVGYAVAQGLTPELVLENERAIFVDACKELAEGCASLIREGAVGHQLAVRVIQGGLLAMSTAWLRYALRVRSAAMRISADRGVAWSSAQ